VLWGVNSYCFCEKFTDVSDGHAVSSALKMEVASFFETSVTYPSIGVQSRTFIECMLVPLFIYLTVIQFVRFL
jgi:hypothetical protein